MRRDVPVHITEDAVPNSCSQFGRRAAALLPMLVILVMGLVTPASAQKDTAVPLAPPAGGTVIPEVTPDGAAVTASVGANSYTFYVYNGGTGSGTVFTSASCSGPGLAGCSASTSGFPLLSGATRAVTVNYTGASSGGTGIVSLYAEDVEGVNTDQGYISVTIPPPAPTYNVSVTPGSFTMNAGTSSYDVTVTNNGTADATYSLGTSCAPMVSACSAPASVYVPHGTSAQVPVSITAGTPGTTGSVTLSASYGGYSGDGLVNVTVNHSYRVEVTPDGSTQTGNGPVQFRVANLGSAQNTFQLSTNVGSLSRSFVTLNQGFQGDTVSVTNGSGTVILTATDFTHNVSDTGSITMVAPTYTVSVGPDGYSDLWREAGQVDQQDFTVTNNGNSQATYAVTGTCEGSGATCTPYSASVPLGPSASMTVPITFTAGPPGSSGTLRVNASGPSSDGGFMRVFVFNRAVAVTPTGQPNGQLVNVEPGTSTQTFTITNSGNAPATYNLTPTCSAAATDCASANQVTVTNGIAAQVNVTYSTATRGASGAVNLTAVATAGNFSGAGFINVKVNHSYAVSVLPDNQTQFVSPSGSVKFFAQNLGTDPAPITLQFSVNCSPTCTLSELSASVNPGPASGKEVTVSLNGYAGTVIFTASDQAHSRSDTGSIIISAPTYTVSVSPDTTPYTVAQQVDANKPGSQTFYINNSGNSLATYSISVSCPSTYIANCNWPTSLQVASQTTGSVPVTFTATGSGGVGTITLTASAQNTSDVGTARWQVNTHYSLVTPKGGTATAYIGPNRTQVFSVKNTGNVTNSYTLTTPCLNAVTACTAAPASVSNLPAGDIASVTVTYTGSAVGAGTARLATSSTVDPAVVDTGSVNVTVKQTYPVEVTPDGATQWVDSATTATVPFSVKNIGTSSGTYFLVLSCGGTAVRGPCTMDATLVTIPAGLSAPVNVRFLAGVPRDTAAISVTAISSDDGSFSDGGSARVTVTTYGVAVIPKALDLAPDANTSDTRRFTVTNTGTTRRAFNLEPKCEGLGATGCSATATALTLDPSVAGTTDVTYTAGDAGASGTVRLRATDEGGRSTDEGSLFVTVSTSVVNNSVQFKDINPGTTIERGQCLIFSIVPDVASECGALRIVHPLPAVHTLGKARVPTLIYSSDQTQGPTLAVNVTLADTATIPTSVQLVVVRTWPDSHLDTLTRTYAGSDWLGNRRRRLAVPNVASGSTGILRYSVAARLVYPSGWVLAAPVDNSELAFVDRTGSPFGAGWWLAGFERLYPGQYDASVLWVAGDGSTRKYVKQQTMTGTDTVYLATALDRPDTLLHRADGTYRRQAGNGLFVEFDGLGLHLFTVNRLGYATVFTYDGNNRLKRLLLPPWRTLGGLSAPAHSYTFAYNAGSGLLETVTAPAVNDKARNVTLGRSGVTSKILSITEQLGDSIYQVTFDASASLIYTSRTDRRGVPTFFTTEASSPTIATFATGTGTGTDTVRHTFRTVGGIGAAVGTESVDSTYFRYDGPRLSPVLDITKFWLGRFGAPVRIVNAANQETRIVRGDPRFPALVTETRGPAPKFFTSRATYNERGNLIASTDVNPRDNLKDATTTYDWDSKWDELTRVILPGLGTTTFGVNPATGNRDWQEDGRGTMSRVTYYYGTDLQLATIQLPGASCSATVRTGCQGIDYDALGNVQRVVSERDAWTTFDRDAIGRVTLTTRGKGTGARIQEKVDLDAADRELLHTTTVPLNPDKLVTDASAAKQNIYVKRGFYRDGSDSAVTRWASPDTSSIGTMVTQYVRDPLGRVTKEIAPDSQVDLTWFGLSGLVESTKTRRGHVTQFGYDVLGRLLTRSADAVTYPSRQWGVAGGGNKPRHNEIKAPFPRYGNGVVPAIRDTLVYDAAGNLSEANNPDARVQREYYSNGQLRQETMRIRTIVTGPVDDTHKYIISRLYDIDGRDSVITHPAQLVARLLTSDGTTRYLYDRTTGTLQSVTDPLGKTVSFGVNARRELTQVTRPGLVDETRTYWPDGAIATQTVRNNTLSQNWRTASFDYDWQGSLSSRQDGARGERFGARYSALGHLLSMADTITLGATNVTKSSDSVDAYGNAYKSDGLTSQTGAYADKNNYFFSSSVNGAALRNYQTGTGRLTRTTTNGGTDEYLYDLSGNVEFLGQFGYTGFFTNYTAQHESRYSYYDAGNQLRFADYRTLSGTDHRTAFEEYRYDALGRRVLVWGRLSCVGVTRPVGQVVSAGSSTVGSVDVSPTCSASFARRVVWDGNQELWEIQAPSTAVGGSLVENDVDPITTGLSLTGASPYADPYLQYGLTAYTFGLELDRPVSVIRANWVGAYTPSGTKTTPVVTSPMAFYPHYLDGGQPYNAAFADGKWFRCVGGGVTYRCLTPAVNFRADFLPWAQGSYVESAWLGSLLSDKQDKTLTFYRRNRVYDPLTRQFTQEDPIGLAGGLNLYGFANGDPVNFSDPFGLCPEGLSNKNLFLCNWIEAGLVVLGADIGGTIGGGSGLTLAIASGGILAPAVPVGAIGGAAIGAIGGKLAGEYLTDRLFSNRSRDKDKEKGQQYEEISKRQRQLRKRGEGEGMNSIKGSKQEDQRELRDEADRALEELRKRNP